LCGIEVKSRSRDASKEKSRQESQSLSSPEFSIYCTYMMKPCAFDDHGAEMNKESWSFSSPTMLPAMMEFCISKL